MGHAPVWEMGYTFMGPIPRSPASWQTPEVPPPAVAWAGQSLTALQFHLARRRKPGGPRGQKHARSQLRSDQRRGAEGRAFRWRGRCPSPFPVVVSRARCGKRGIPSRKWRAGEP